MHAQSPQALAKLRVAEKRWAVYVARAVDRFERWYDACVPATMGGAPCEKLTGNQICTKKGLDKVAYHGISIKQLTLKDQLPPLDVLMVWHSYMLNPRCFFEDCFRYGKFIIFNTTTIRQSLLTTSGATRIAGQPMSFWRYVLQDC